MPHYQVVQKIDIVGSPEYACVVDGEDCRRIAEAVSLLAENGLSTTEIEEDILAMFDFLDDCTISSSQILVSVIQGADESSMRWPTDGLNLTSDER